MCKILYCADSHLVKSSFGTDSLMHACIEYIFHVTDLSRVNIGDLYMMTSVSVEYYVFIMSFLNRMFQMGWNVFLFFSEYFPLHIIKGNALKN